MSKFIDETGNRFGRLTVIKEVGRNKHKNVLWECLCDCGNTVTTVGTNLRKGATKSCGCLHATHGMSATLVYDAWKAMIQRCNNANTINYKYYGARGITVCDRWLKFENFFEDMGERLKGLTIDRIDNDGNYELTNCRWATSAEQSKNHRLQKNNKTGCKGVYWDKRDKRFVAYIANNKKRIHLGSFTSIEDAITARKAAELKYWNKA